MYVIALNNKEKMLGGGVSTQAKTLAFDDELNLFMVANGHAVAHNTSHCIEIYIIINNHKYCSIDNEKLYLCPMVSEKVEQQD